MSEGILSQDEIDALLGAGEAGVEKRPGGSGGEPDGMGAFAAGDVGEVLRVAVEAGIEALADYLGTSGSAEAGALRPGLFGEMLAAVGGEQVAVDMEFEGELGGGALLLFPREAAAAIGALALGGDASGAAGEAGLGGLRTALAEVATQFSAALTTILMADVTVRMGEPVPVDCSSEADRPSTWAAGEEVVRQAFHVVLGTAAFDAYVFVPRFVAEELSAVLARQEVEEKEEILPGPSPAPRRPRIPEPPLPEGGVAPGGAPPATRGHVANVREARFADLRPGKTEGEKTNLDILLDVPLRVTVELGRTSLQIREILELGKGSVVELDKLAGEPVEIFVNGKLIAKGEVVTIDENFGVKITEIVSKAERVNHLGDLP